MNSILSTSRIFPGMKRRHRPKSKPEISSPRAKPLDILPELSEEDEGRQSFSSVSSFDSTLPKYYASRSVGGSATLGNRLSVAERKRDSRRVVLTGAEGLSFEDFFPSSSAPQRPPPAPAPLLLPDNVSSRESPLDDINLRFSGLGISLDFPSPPPDRSSSSIHPLVPNRPTHSPTPSMSSIHTYNTSSSSSSSRSRAIELTPPTSEDECLSSLKRAPALKSRRASVLFMKSVPDLNHASVSASAAEEDVDEDAKWFAHDISDVVAFSSRDLPSFSASLAASSSRADPSARPDSLVLPTRTGRSRHSKPLPNLPRRPSLQLDPTFPHRRKSFLIPDRPPPPPPIVVSPSSMEEETEELLAQLASAALNSGFVGTGLVSRGDGYLTPVSMPPTPSSTYIVSTPHLRPPPRTSLPADIHDLPDEAPWTPGAGEVEVEISPEIEGENAQGWPSTPQSVSVYSQASMSVDTLQLSPMSSFDFEVEIVPGECPAIPDTPAARIRPREGAQPDRVLRSRWSSSTLGSAVERPSSASFWIPRFNLSPTKKNAAKRIDPQKTPVSPGKQSFESDAGMNRRESRNSRMSSDSGDSSASCGLRRKPIPVEIFMR
ncbi:predicted protein [Sparassis crispa]|uniref:Uncharacterized protein n=1 Tax=Sparassis crispa TaxID=139825 RepID=A0A401H465_9APHY|nr:predicted protein [Sparassis crispa]GBE89235.1 predicted protein [Sparassis crispa]